MELAQHSAEPAMVTLRRDDPRDVGHRQVYARIDGFATHTMLFGDVVQLKLPAGAHVLKANNTLVWKSLAFSLAPGQHLEFVLINRASRFGFGVLTLLGVAPIMLSIEQRPGVPLDAP